MHNIMNAGTYTIERFADERGISRQSALNLLSTMKKKGLATVRGGGREKRLYAIFDRPQEKTNGFYDMVNKYSPEKLRPRFAHHVRGRYTVEHAIIDGIRIGDARTKEATMHLFLRVTDWTRLFALAKKHDLKVEVIELYQKARMLMRTKRMPRRYT
jgi:hypothetical protein